MSHTLIAIPLCQLKPSKANMRKTDKLTGIAELAASIAANGLLENLVVHPLPANGDDTSYEVVAGGRRLAALKRLAKARTLDRNHPVACLLIEDGDALTEISLTENFERVPPHPADQFEAFADLVKDGRSPEEVASRFGITAQFVQQRLKLAQVSPRLIAQYREGTMTLEQLMAFTVSDDHALQDAVWFESPYADMPAQFIRRQLTKTQVEASDRRVRFVGIEAYEATGGTVVRDLFDTAHDGYLDDSQLLDRLVAEKLETIAQALRDQGWSFVETLAEEDYSYLSRFGRVPPTDMDLPKKDEKRLDQLAERYDELVSALEDEENEDVRAELDRLESQIDALRARKEVWPETDRARSGAVIALNFDGTVSVTRGLLRPQDGETSMQTAAKPKPVRSGYPESVLLDLSAHKTAAMRASLADQPRMAFLLLLHALTSRVFLGRGLDCLEIRVTETALDRASQTVGASKAMQALLAHQSQWAERMPDADNLWSWLLSLEESERHGLLAYCVAVSVNALCASQGEPEGADRLAAILALDMKQWWSADEGFFSRLTKSDVIEAVGQVRGEEAARRLADLKKSELAKRAQDLLANSGWLPMGLRALNAT